MATASTRKWSLPGWTGALIPVAVIGALIAVFVALDPIGGLRDAPPIESLAIERTTLNEDEIVLRVRNDGPDPVSIAQVLVNDAYWNFSADDTDLGRLEATSISLEYPWEEGLPLTVTMLTSTGVTIEHEIEAAALTPQTDAETLGIYALLGLYIGVIPVAVGLLWFPALRRASRRWLGFFLAFTVGLLAFLLVETIAEGIELSEATAATLNGIAVFAMGALTAVVALLTLERAFQSKGEAHAGLTLAYLIAVGIGLHNLGEGLAVGAALAAGEAALGTFLVIGFAVHNTTEGLAIVAPLGGHEERPSLWHFVALGAVAGLPTVAGAWAGGFSFSPVWGAFAFGVAAGAIAQVIWAIARTTDKQHGILSPLGAAGFMAGLIVMYATGLFTA